jgi:hypothetical protein
MTRGPRPARFPGIPQGKQKAGHPAFRAVAVEYTGGIHRQIATGSTFGQPARSGPGRHLRPPGDGVESAGFA